MTSHQQAGVQPSPGKQEYCYACESGSKEGCWLATAFSAGPFHVGEIPGRLQFLT